MFFYRYWWKAQCIYIFVSETWWNHKCKMKFVDTSAFLSQVTMETQAYGRRDWFKACRCWKVGKKWNFEPDSSKFRTLWNSTFLTARNFTVKLLLNFIIFGLGQTQGYFGFAIAAFRRLFIHYLRVKDNPFQATFSFVHNL